MAAPQVAQIPASSLFASKAPAAFQLPAGAGRNPMAQYGTQAATKLPIAESAETWKS